MKSVSFLLTSSGAATIEDGVTMTVKSGGDLRLLSEATLTVDEGGKIVFESGADLVMASLAKVILETSASTGGVMELEDAAILTVDYGSKLEAKAGSEIRCGHNARLEIEGELKATGTSSNEVLFTRLEASDTWKGIVVERSSGSQKATIDYARIEHCETGLRVGTNGTLSLKTSTVDGVLTGVEFTSFGGATGSSIIHDNTFSNIATTGILVSNLSTLTIDGNSIDEAFFPNSPTSGIRVNSSSPEILNNTITDFDRGVQCLSGSDAVFEDGDNGGYNTIENNGVGVYVKTYSDPILGEGDGTGSDEGGQNCIVGVTYDLDVSGSSSVLAENNYWDDKDFNIEGGSNVDATPHLTSCPTSSRMAQGSKGGKPFSDPLSEELELAVSKYIRGDYTGAIALLEDIIEDEEHDILVRESAVSFLLACGQKRDSSSVTQFLESSGASFEELERVIDFMLPHAYLNDGNASKAMELFDSNIRSYSGTSLELNGLYGLFQDALYVERDSADAHSYFEMLEDRFPESDEAFIAGIQLQSLAMDLV